MLAMMTNTVIAVFEETEVRTNYVSTTRKYITQMPHWGGSERIFNTSHPTNSLLKTSRTSRHYLNRP